MSRIGRKAIPVPQGVDIKIDNQSVTVKGKLGTLSRNMHPQIEVKKDGDTITVAPRAKDRKTRALWGLSRSLLNNMVVGVSEGFSKQLEILGVGYRAAVSGQTLKLTLGYSHHIEYKLPEGVSAQVDKNNTVTVSGADRETIGQTCAEIRDMRSPEPYKGKGIRYAGEYVLRKEGKKK
ncbi:MAG: 50S ribosomal protein L6 [Magnetococcales bacterium]|nr:50S ribosomal protein L6 [Magnetococcales bacterium]